MSTPRTICAFVMVMSLAVALVSADWEEGKAALNRGDYEAARHHFAEAVENNPDYAWAHYYLGLALEGLDNVDSAVAHFDRAAQLEPDNAGLALKLGATLLAAGDSARATEVLIGIDPGAVTPQDQAKLALLTAKASLDSDRPSAAVETLEEAIKTGPDSPDLQRAYGAALAALGRDIDAFRAYRSAFELGGDQKVGQAAVSAGLRAMSAAGDEAGDLQEQIATLAAAVADRHPSRDTLLNAGRLALERGDTEGAVALLEKAQNVAADDAEVLLWAGRALRCQGDITAAKDRLRSAAASAGEPDVTRRAHAELARIAESELDLEAAVEHHREAGNTKRASALDEVRDRFAESLEQRRQYQRQIDELRRMAEDLGEIGEAEGVSTVEVKVDELERAVADIDANLAEVRESLASAGAGCD